MYCSTKVVWLANKFLQNIVCFPNASVIFENHYTIVGVYNFDVKDISNKTFLSLNFDILIL